MAIVHPPASRQPSCAALSQPNARPLTMILPSSANCFPNSYAFFNPDGEAARAPMMAIRLAFGSRSDISLSSELWAGNRVLSFSENMESVHLEMSVWQCHTPLALKSHFQLCQYMFQRLPHILPVQDQDSLSVMISSRRIAYKEYLLCLKLRCSYYIIVLVISFLYKVTVCQFHCKDTIIPYRPNRIRL